MTIISIYLILEQKWEEKHLKIELIVSACRIAGNDNKISICSLHFLYIAGRLYRIFKKSVTLVLSFIAHLAHYGYLLFTHIYSIWRELITITWKITNLISIDDTLLLEHYKSVKFNKVRGSSGLTQQTYVIKLQVFSRVHNNIMDLITFRNIFETRFNFVL